MKVTNISSRPHHVGDVLIAPGESALIEDRWANAINKVDLEVAEKPAKASSGTPAKDNKTGAKEDRGA